MNWSLADVADVPAGVVTVTSTVPALPAGEVAVTDVAESAVIDAAFAPKSTAVAEPRFVPVITTELPPAVRPALGEMLVTVGGGWTFSVKLCWAGASMPLVAVRVMGNVPLAVGVPDRTPPLKVTPAGSVPDSVMTGAGLPDAVGVKVPADPWKKVVALADVKAAGELPLGPGTAVHVNPLGSPALARNVTSVFQLSATAPLLLAQTRPASHTPRAEAPEPV